MFGTYRTLLALMVVAMHLGGLHAIGGYAVFGFYILSGYLMTFIMQNNYGYSFSGIARYAINRVLRIYPIYWVSISFSLILIFLFGEQFTSEYRGCMVFPKTVTDVLNNIFLFFPNLKVIRLTPPAWALTVELFFYILIGIGISKNKRIVSAWLILSVMYHIYANYKGLGWLSRYIIIPAASLPFATGACICHFKEKILKIIRVISGKTEEFLPFILFVLILVNWFVGFKTGHARGGFFYINYILCSLMVVILADRKTLPFISRKFDKWMGDFSYPIYLIHYQVGLVVVYVLRMMGFGYKRPDAVVLFISIPLVFIVAWILTVVLEKPIESIRARVKQANISNGSKHKT